MNPLIQELTQEQLRTDIPAFRPGDTVRVHAKVVEGTRERIQLFEGVVIKRRGAGISETYTVRKVSNGVGVERTFPLHTPRVAQIEVVRYGKVRRAKLYYLRALHGKQLVSKKSVVNLYYSTNEHPLAQQEGVFVCNGGLGNLALQYAKHVFNAKVVAVDVNDNQLAFAKEMGADLLINPVKDPDFAAQLQKEIGGVHAAVVTAVAKSAFNGAVDAVRAGGTVVAVGLPVETMDLSIPRLVLDGIHVVGSLVGTRQDLREAFQFGAEGKVVPVCQTRQPEEINAIFEEMEQGKIRGRMVIDFRS